MAKTLLYAFGPDGAGKSTLINSMTGGLGGSSVIPASRPDLWPDLSWHNEMKCQGLTSDTKDPSYHIETLNRCYGMAANLLATCETPLIIDSDPRAQIAAKACALYGVALSIDMVYGQLDDLARNHLGDDIQQLGLHVTVGRGNPEERAFTLLQRLEQRNDNSSFDPASIEQARDLVVTFDALESTLLRRNEPCIRVETDRPFDVAQLSRQVLALHT